MSRPLGPVMLDVSGMTLTDEEREILHHPQVGGLILFSRNYDSPEQLMALIRQIRECRHNILIAVDHEGGRVQRFRTGFTRIPSMHTLAQQAPEQLLPTSRLMALELMAVGIDFTFAPVLDRYNPQSKVIGDRAFDHEPSKIIEFAGQFIQGLELEGMAAVGKHFPGHGGVEGDTHHESPQDLRDWEEVAASDLKPFAALCKRLAGVMPAHVIFPNICELPVGFSPHWLKSVLKEQLQFQGIVMSDDLSMVAAHSAGSPLERGLQALQAGCHLALLCNQPADAVALIEGLERECPNTYINESRLLSLSAFRRRAQTGFSWQTLQKTAFWQTQQRHLYAFQ